LTVQVFISYARDDDVAPPGRDEAKGFVTYLDEQLRYELTQLGQPRPRLWRDTRRIERGDQFEPLIEEAVASSSLFVAMLSRNWLDRPWCRRELESFRQRWSSESEEQLKRRIIVVARHPVPESEIPTLLRGQEGFRFFDVDRDSETGQWQEFFVRGRIRDPRYEERVGELARFLWQAAARLETPGATPQLDRRKGPSFAPPGGHGRTIYLAKPAADMRLAYDRIAKELQRAGYTLVPPPDSEIPYDGTAPGFVDAALAGAELSIHLLGDKPGYSPEDAEPIVKLQLARAAARAEAPQASERVFRRILWAPRFVTEEAEAGAERDPLAVVGRLDRQLDGDTVVGDNLSAFAEFLVQHLERSAPSREVSGAIPDGAQVYVYHRREDEDYALDLAMALRQRRLKAVLPAVEGEAAELDAFHRENLRECQAVVLCWAKASEVWARATCRELRSWEKLGRSERFTVRGLVAGPPPGGRKSVLVRLPPEDEIDVVLDLTALDKPSPAALDSLIRAAAPPPAE
jgi:TIR domain